MDRRIALSPGTRSSACGLRWEFAPLWDEALTLEEFISESSKRVEPWNWVYQAAAVPEEVVVRAGAIASELRLVAIVEDWGGRSCASC